MRRWRNILSILALALWLPATLHCALESIPGLEFLACASEHSSSERQSGDRCCAVERTIYKNEQVRQTLRVPALLPLPPALPSAVEAELPADSRFGILTTAPPGTVPLQLSQRWQFFSRTALPARAPSLIS